MSIQYQVEKEIDAAEFVDVLNRSTLGARRPVDNPGRINKMLQHANLVITARDEGKLVGIARSISDFGFCTYLSDLAVDVAYQHSGIGKRLITETQSAAPDATLILLAAPAAAGYYPKIGMKQFSDCFILKANETLP